MKRSIIVLTLLLLAARPLHARSPEIPYEEAHSGAMALTGLGFGAAAFLMGFAFGAEMSDDTGMFAGAAEGLLVGSTLGALALGAGVHAGNDGRGDALKVVGASLAIGAVGMTVAAGAGSEEILIATVLAQLIGAIAVEQATARRKHEARIGTWSTPEGSPGLAVQLSF